MATLATTITCRWTTKRVALEAAIIADTMDDLKEEILNIT